MTKTIEITHNNSRYDGESFTIVSPDHKSDEDVDGFTLPDNYGAVTIDGITRVDIPNEKYFHLDRTYEHHIEISVHDDRQHDEIEVSLPYRESYTFNELVTELGIPKAYGALRHQPDVSVNISYEDGAVRVKSVEVDGETFTKDVQSE